jgi:hypothetical protein
MPRAAVHELVLRACTSGAAVVVGAAALWFALLPRPVSAQTPPPAPAQAAPAASAARPASALGAPALAASRPQVAASPAASASRPLRTASGAKSNGRRTIKPLWRDLRPAEQQALAPLASTWDTISYVQKRKWLTVSQNFPKLAPAEQEKLHSRMTEWVALSPQQRTQARLNFGATQQLSPDDKKAKWEAYQALPAEEKRKLAAAAPKPPTTAAAVKPLPAGKLATVPRAKPVAKSPRIAGPSDPVDRNTLLPRTAPASAPARAG